MKSTACAFRSRDRLLSRGLVICTDVRRSYGVGGWVVSSAVCQIPELGHQRAGIVRGYLHFRIAKNIAPSSDKALAVMRRCIFLTGLSSPGKPLEAGTSNGALDQIIHIAGFADAQDFGMVVQELLHPGCSGPWQTADEECRKGGEARMQRVEGLRHAFFPYPLLW